MFCVYFLFIYHSQVVGSVPNHSCAPYDHAAVTVRAGCASPVQSVEETENAVDKHALYTHCCYRVALIVPCLNHNRFICISSALVFSVVMLSATQDFSSLGVRCIHWQSKASLIVSVSMDMSIMKL